MRKFVLVASAVLIAAVVAWFGRAAVTGSAATLPAETARVTRREINSVVKATGLVRAAIDAEVRVGVQSPGLLRKLHVRVGDQVAQGQLLAELESRSLRAKYSQAVAAQQSGQANLVFETVEHARKRRLVEEQVLAPRELDLAERALALANAATAEARANVAYARAVLDDTRVLAPISGVVAAITTHEGETVASGLSAPSLVTLIDLKRLETWTYVDETDIGRIELGQAAKFSVDTYPDHDIEGRVIAIQPKPEIRDNVVDYVVVIGFVTPTEVTLRPEMTANVRIALGKRDKVLTVPRRALHREQGRSFVLLPTSSPPTQRYVKTGSKDDNDVEVVEGLSEGNEVLVGDLPNVNATTD